MRDRLTILNVAFPAAPVTPGVVGGAEQVLGALDRELVRVGHRSMVIAAGGSETSGTLVSTGPLPDLFSDAALAAAQARTRECIDQVLHQESIDLIHFHGVDFYRYLPHTSVPMLATLHLPASFYPDEVWQNRKVWIHAVSMSQHRTCPPGGRLLSPIENGIDVSAFRTATKDGFALSLGRICPEKGYHLAVEAARKASVPLVIAGNVYPYAEHQQYFEEVLQPLLDADRRFIGPVAPAARRDLLSRARCLLVPSLVPETGCLVAMEALASGTPVVGFADGALVDVVDHGHTGFLVNDVTEMALAIDRCHEIDPADCRRAAHRRFSIRPMLDGYLHRYRLLTQTSSNNNQKRVIIRAA